MYDGQEHTPKLLACSHTVCRQCLERIASSSQPRDTGAFRCPICRETITLPRGGVSALPPSFLVNQLLDLMSRQRREVIPKCSSHPNQELLFCETCDCVFCTICTGEQHGNGDGGSVSCEHTVIPFSIAIKRMSEILLYKAHQCIGKLNKAGDNVTTEMHKLEQNVEHTFDTINQSFQELVNKCEKRRQEVLGLAKKTRDEKKKVLQEQLALINAEKAKVQEECEGLQYQVEVRSITKKISDLNVKLEQVATLLEPRENCFMKYDYKQNSVMNDIQLLLESFGHISISKTFPALCTARPTSSAVVHLEIAIIITTVDYHGDLRTSGGDPVVASFFSTTNNSTNQQPCFIRDLNDGSYVATFVPKESGQYTVAITIFDRPIKSSPLRIEVGEHNSPVAQLGSRGSGNEQFTQPVGIAANPKNGEIYVADTGNSRVKVLTSSLQFVRHLDTVGVEERSCTGIALSITAETLVVVNWRTKRVTEMTSQEGRLVNQFSHADLTEPIDVAVDSTGDVLVADNGLGAVLVFEPSGKLIRKIGNGKGTTAGYFNLITSVTVGCHDDVVVTDSRIQIFSKGGEFLREIYAGGKNKGKYGGVIVDGDGVILATRSEKAKNFIQVFSYEGDFLFTIDSWDSRLKRPSGLTVLGDHVIVVDLGNDCIKKYRYK